MESHRPVKVFISYSWDSEAYCRRVLELSDKLEAAGIKTIIDKNLVYGERLTSFMESLVSECDYVLFLCTPNYKKKSDNRIGGVGYEGHIITGALLETNNERKFIPVLMGGNWNDSVPIWAKGKRGADLSDPNKEDQNLPELIDHLLGKNAVKAEVRNIASSKRTPPLWALKTTISVGDWVSSIALTNKYLVSGDLSGRICIWDIDSGKHLQTLEGCPGSIRCLAVYQDSFIVSGSGDKSVRIWCPYLGEYIKEFGTQKYHGPVTCTTFTENGNIITGSWDHVIRIWDPHTGNCAKEYYGHKGPINYVAVTTNERIVSSSADHTIRLWDRISGNCLQVIDGNGAFIKCLAITNDGQIASGYDNSIRIWDPNSGSCLSMLSGHTAPISCLAVAPNGNIISGSNDKTIRIWNPNSGDCLQTLEGHHNFVTCLAVAPDGHIFSGSIDRTIRVWAPMN